MAAESSSTAAVLSQAATIADAAAPRDHTQAPIEDAVELTEEEQETLSTPSHSPNGSFTKSRRSSRSSSVEQLPLVESIARAEQASESAATDTETRERAITMQSMPPDATIIIPEPSC